MKILLLFLVWQALSTTCRNHDGNKVDWWLMLNVRGGSGLTYLYCDSDSCDELEYKNAFEINSSESPLFQTVQKLDFNLDSEPNILNFAWNDQQVEYVAPKLSDSSTSEASTTEASTSEGSKTTTPRILRPQDPIKERNRKAQPTSDSTKTAPSTPKAATKRKAASEPESESESEETDQEEESVLPQDDDNTKKIDPPGGAHSKGILSVSSKSKKGFIINHSLPRFPLIKDNKIERELYHNAGSKAQHFFCMSLAIDQIENIAKLYSLAQLHIQTQTKVKTEFQTKYPHISNLAVEEENSDTKDNKVDKVCTNSKANIEVKTLGLGSKSYSIKVFARSEKCHQDIYEYIAETLEIGLITETWGVGTAPLKRPYSLKTDNSNYKLDKNHKIRYEFAGGKVIEYTNTVDHSKYAISDNSAKPYVCFGDLNWVRTTNPRGGTVLCFEHKKLWENIKKSFVAKDKTKRRRK